MIDKVLFCMAVLMLVACALVFLVGLARLNVPCSDINDHMIGEIYCVGDERVAVVGSSCGGSMVFVNYSSGRGRKILRAALRSCDA